MTWTYCDDCANQNMLPKIPRKNFARCDICEEMKLCYDFSKIKKDKKKTKKQKQEMSRSGDNP